MANQTFSAQVGDWVKRVKLAELAIFREAAQELQRQLTEQLSSMIYEKPSSPDYKRTQFLLASLVASTSEMPKLERENPGVEVTPNFDQVELVINNAELGEVIHIGYSAVYGGYVHGGTSKMPPRPWVTLVAQRWQAIVDQAAVKVRKDFGL